MPYEAYERLGKVVGVLVEHLDGYIRITQEEIEDAPEVDVIALFETDEVELKVR